MYDNQIEKIENLEFASPLQYLYLQNNQIAEIPDMSVTNLTKLFLDENRISYVAGLDKCTKLEELYVASQSLPRYSSLTFDPASLEAIARTLQVLDISGNGIQTLSPFIMLTGLRKLFAGKNEIADITELEEIVGLPRLEEAVFSENPCCSIRKYRDYVIGASSDALQMLDEVPVQKHQQVAIRGLMAHRRRLGTATVEPVLTSAQHQAINEYDRSVRTDNSSLEDIEEGGGLDGDQNESGSEDRSLQD